MKTISSALRAHLQQEVTTLATCWKVVRRDGKAFYFTDHDADLGYQGNVYESAVGYVRTAFSTQAGFAPDNADVTGYFDSAGISEDELRAGLFDRAEVHSFVVNWADLSMGQLNLRRGWMGECVLNKQGVFTTELRGLMQTLSQQVGEAYSFNCRADLGDARCKIPLLPPVLGRSQDVALGASFRVASGATVDGQGLPDSRGWGERIFTCTVAGTTAGTAPTFDFTVGATTQDGTAKFQCAEAWARSAIVTSTDGPGRSWFQVTFPQPDSRMVDKWFENGLATWETGLNAGASMEIRWFAVADNSVTLFLPMGFEVGLGDRLVLLPGCNRNPTACSAKFNNILNYRGEPFLPGRDQIMFYPDSTG